MNSATNPLDPRPALGMNRLRPERVLGGVLWIGFLIVLLRFAAST